jgi:hypothetical protein
MSCYKLEEIGGMNSEMVVSERWFERLDEVMEWFKKNDVRDDDGNLVEELKGGDWMESWCSRDGKIVKRDYMVNEGMVLLEMKGNLI